MKKDIKDYQKIYFVVPKLIEQPTWGGDYILNTKNWKGKQGLRKIKIGQSYELFSGSKLRSDIVDSDDNSFTCELGQAMDINKVAYRGNKSKLIKIDKLIKQSPEKILGKKVIKKHGRKIKILIKFTQAKGNSFQIHVREKDESRKWKFKPESWFFLEPGKITLGVKEKIAWNEYFASCKNIENEMWRLSKSVTNKRLSLINAKKEANSLVEKSNPWKYVNTLRTKREDIVDLSSGGVHHSWEEDNDLIPEGNIVYELCLDVMDPVSVLRSFDKGKFKADGSLRKLNIEEYFIFIDRYKKNNKPEKHRLIKQEIFSSKNLKVEKIVRTKYYNMDKLTLSQAYVGKFTETNNNYHHLFVKAGKIEIESEFSKVTVGKGHSVFIPSAIGKYSLNSKSKKSEILKTYII